MKDLMKAAVFHGKHDVRVENVPIPEVKDNEVLVKVAYCGVCGTDVHIFEGDKGCAEVHPPCILGHEFAGTIVKLGKSVTSRAKGDRVTVDPNVLCDSCKYCLEAKGHFCTHMTGIGTTTNGGFAEYVAVPAKQTHLVNANTPLETAAMTEPLACCLHGMDMCEIKAGDRVAVIGAGMIGLIMIQLARLSGATKIVAIEPVEKKRADAIKAGADEAFAPSDKTDEELCAYDFNCVIECAGLTSTISRAIAIAGKKAIVMMFGLTKPDDEVAIKPYDLFVKELTLKTSYINPYTQERALQLIESGRVDVKSMACDPIPLEKLADVLGDAKLRAQGKFIVKL